MTPDFFALPRPPRLSETVSLEADGRRLTVTLRAMDLLDMHRMITLRDRMVARYVPFDQRRRPPDAGSPAPLDFPPVGGEPVRLSEETCEACASLAVMQPEGGLGFEQLVACAAACPNLFTKLAETAAALNRREPGKAPTAGSSVTP